MKNLINQKDHVKFNESEIISESLKWLRPELREVACQAHGG